jgi:peptidoglycan/xylan/chitin deacetylase (PgdA/CDA1 family)
MFTKTNNPARKDKFLSRKRCIVPLVVLLMLAAPARPSGVQVLMYHAVDTYGISPAAFQEEMEFLRAEKYSTLTLDDLVEWIRHDTALPYRPIVLTFDDNYLSVYTVVYPVLQARGFVGTDFAHTDYVGVAAPGPPPTSYDHCDWNELQEMETAGVISVQSHSKTHPYLTSVPIDQAWAEIYESKLAIEAHLLNKTCKYLAYPYGAYDSTALDMVELAGYEAAFTTIEGGNTRNTPLYELRRTAIVPEETLNSFKSKIGYYDIPHELGYVLDNLDANCSTTGTWTSSVAIAGYWHQDSVYHSPGTGDATACWAVRIPQTGGYKLYARWTSAANRATNARYTVAWSSGSDEIIVDQTTKGGQWNLLGNYSFFAGEPLRVFLDGNANGYVIADAIRLMPASSGVAYWMCY